MLIVRAPTRISFLGGGTDFPPYYERHGGVVVSAAIDKYFYAIFRPHPERSLEISSSDFRSYFRHPGEIPLDWDGTLALPRAVLHEFGVSGGLAVFLASEIPPGTGLGSSSSVAVAMVRALSLLLDREVSKADVARVASEIEIRKLRMPIGRQDAYASSFGGLNRIDFSRAGVSVQPLNLTTAMVEALEARLALFFTGSSRESTRILERQQRRTESHDSEIVRELDALKSLAKAADVLLRQGSLDAFGELLHDGWLLKQRLTTGISNEQIDRWYRIAREAGATGGKVTGAGGGGFLLLYVKPEVRTCVESALATEGLTPMPFHFDQSGARVLMHSGQSLSVA